MSDSTNYSISKQDIEQAHLRIAPFIHNTPVLRSTKLDELAGCKLFFKCENFQKVGAFKIRGATNAILQLSDTQKENGVVTHSSGNHAQALALSAEQQNCKAFIVMPKNAPKVKIDAVKEYGGIITFCEPNLAARESTVEGLIKKKNATFIHPYDNLDIIKGQATAAKELLESNQDLDSIICPVGGGGLLAGSILAAHYFGKNSVVHAGEPKGADDAFKSIQAGKIIPSTQPKTIADGLLTSLGVHNFEIISKGIKAIHLVEESDIIEAMKLIWERLKIVVEPSSAVPFAAILKNKEVFKNQKVGVIVSGGNVDLTKYFNAINQA